MLSVKIIEASHMVEKEHGEILLNILKEHKQFYKNGDLLIGTNIRFKEQVPQLIAFNSVLQKYQMSGDTHILIKLNK